MVKLFFMFLIFFFLNLRCECNVPRRRSNHLIRKVSQLMPPRIAKRLLRDERVNHSVFLKTLTKDKKKIEASHASDPTSEEVADAALKLAKTKIDSLSEDQRRVVNKFKEKMTPENSIKDDVTNLDLQFKFLEKEIKKEIAILTLHRKELLSQLSSCNNPVNVSA